VVGVVAVGYLVVAATGATRNLLLDDRIEDLSLGGAAFAAFVRVPLGTVLLEEIAFRGVLIAQLRARASKVVAVGTSAVLFGLWHVLPSLGLSSVNPVADGAVGDLPSVVTVVGSVVFTAIAGVWFWWLRDRSGSLLAPMLAHWSTNGLGYLFAWWAWQQ
jgi:membrane protease YdiL (CAAX protease family)